jgi:hypothetical protein
MSNEIQYVVHEWKQCTGSSARGSAFIHSSKGSLSSLFDPELKQFTVFIPFIRY